MTTNKSSSTRLIPTYWYNMIQHGFFISVFSAPIQRHTMHVVPISPWPIVTAFSIMFLLITTVGFFRYVPFSSSLIFLCLFLFISSLLLWGSDVILEGTLLRMHTLLMQRSFVFAVILFILSEVMFFFSFFWSFFHYSLSPSVFIYCVWPPIGISIISPWGIPFLNTIILLSSGVSLTVAHRAFLSNRFITASVYLFYTIVLGLLFTLCQLFEYMNCSFSINDSVYGSIFFFNDRFPWFACYSWYCFFNFNAFSITMWNVWGFFFFHLSYRFWFSSLILAFCWCCLTFFVFCRLLMRFLVFFMSKYCNSRVMFIYRL